MTYTSPTPIPTREVTVADRYGTIVVDGPVGHYVVDRSLDVLGLVADLADRGDRVAKYWTIRIDCACGYSAPIHSRVWQGDLGTHAGAGPHRDWLKRRADAQRVAS